MAASYTPGPVSVCKPSKGISQALSWSNRAAKKSFLSLGKLNNEHRDPLLKHLRSNYISCFGNSIDGFIKKQLTYLFY